MKRNKILKGLVFLIMTTLALSACQLLDDQELPTAVPPANTLQPTETATNTPQSSATATATPTPTAEPTERPPTVTPSVTATPTLSGPGRINFPPGATSTTVEGNLSWPDQDRYVFRALEGQQVRIDITSEGQAANFALVGLEDGQPYKRVVNEDRFWFGVLALTQDYELTVALPGSGESVDYTLALVIESVTEPRVIINPGSPPAEACIAAHPGAGPPVNILAGPGEQFALLAHLGNWAEILDSEIGWHMILIGPTEVGWVRADAVVLAGPCDEVALEPFLVINEEVQAFAGPDTAFEALQTLLAGQQVTLFGRNADSTWWAIPGPGDGPSPHAWVADELVTVHGDTSGLPVLPLSETGAPVILNPGEPPADSCVALALGLGPSVKVYAAMSTDQAIVAELSNWAIVLTTEGDWHQIVIGPDESGWITNDSITLSGPCS